MHSLLPTAAHVFVCPASSTSAGGTQTEFIRYELLEGSAWCLSTRSGGTSPAAGCVNVPLGMLSLLHPFLNNLCRQAVLSGPHLVHLSWQFAVCYISCDPSLKLLHT